MLLRYKQWADDLAFGSVASIPAEEAYKNRRTPFGSIVQTLNHVYVVDDIFHHHLIGSEHGYTARVTSPTPPLAQLREAAARLNRRYIEAFDQWSDTDLAAPVSFTFVGGGAGSMTRAQIGLHVVNHATYHRGFVGDLLRQVPFQWPANDLTIFLREKGSGCAT